MLRGPPRVLSRTLRGATLRLRSFMNYPWLIKGLLISAILVLGALRIGWGLAAASGLGQFPISWIPVRLRRLLFGEHDKAAHKLGN